jgi:hypothetical protein
MREKVIASLRTRGLDVEECSSAWVISVIKGAVRFRITVPFQVLEWFVSAYIDDREIWKDWAEFYGDANTSILEKEYGSSILAFIDRVVSMDVRYVEPNVAHDYRRLQWRHDGDWRGVELVENDEPA